MKWSTRSILIAAVTMAVGGGFADAQQTEETRRRQMQVAEQRAQEAMQELQRALQLMEEAKSDEARRQLGVSIRNLEAARSRLGTERRAVGFATPELFVSSYGRGGPQMGVYLNSERRSSTDSIGVVLNSVVEDGPADEAGLRDGDIITRANGESLAREGRGGTSPANKLIQIKDDLEEGDTLHVEYRRGATNHTADIEVRYLNDNTFSMRSFVGGVRDFPEPNITVVPGGVSGTITLGSDYFGRLSMLGWLDVELLELDENLGWYFGVTEGLLVVRVPDDDNQMDLLSGDVIVSVDGRRPSSQTQLTRILRSYEEGETMQIEIMRQREPMTIEATVPERDNEFYWRPGRQ